MSVALKTQDYGIQMIKSIFMHKRVRLNEGSVNIFMHMYMYDHTVLHSLTDSLQTTPSLGSQTP